MEKCVCGHTIASDGEKKFNENVTEEMVNAEPFIRIEGRYYAPSNGWDHVLFEEQDEYIRNNSKRIYLHACPKCGTVRVAN